MGTQVAYRTCEQGHVEPPKGYWYNGDYEDKLWSGKNHCVTDGSKVFWVQIDTGSDKFKKLFTKIPENIVCTHDAYDMVCDNGHKKTVGGYGSNSRYKFCEICGTPMKTIRMFRSPEEKE